MLLLPVFFFDFSFKLFKSLFVESIQHFLHLFVFCFQFVKVLAMSSRNFIICVAVYTLQQLEMIGFIFNRVESMIEIIEVN